MSGSGLEPAPHRARGVASMGGAAGFCTGTLPGVWPPPCPSASRSFNGPNGPSAMAVTGAMRNAATALRAASTHHALMRTFFPGTLAFMPDETTPERQDLQELLARRAMTLDAARPDAVARRHEQGGRTARENIDDLVDPGSFVEYGALAIAAQRARRDVRELIEGTPADGLVAGTARVNGELFGDRAACAVLSYDYTVLAGTQGVLGHRKKDRLFELIARMRLPTVFFAEGGGGRPGDTDYPVVSSLEMRAFALWAELSGLVPRIAVVAGRCFAGNAVIAGCSDLIVATENSSLGMGGPAMIEGGGLGKVDPDEVGPIEMQAGNGVVDVLAADEREATAVAKRLLGYFQGKTAAGAAPDQARLRELVPERQRRAYAVAPIVEALADEDSVTFLRERFAPEMVTALAR